MTWVRLARPDVETWSFSGRSSWSGSRVLLGSRVVLMTKLTVVLLSGGLVRLVAGNLDSVQAQLDAADRRSGAGACDLVGVYFVSLRSSAASTVFRDSLLGAARGHDRR